MATRLTRMKIDEVSLVDAPASKGANVLIIKSALGHLAGAADAHASLLEQHGADAADAFATALADMSLPIEKAAGADGVEAVVLGLQTAVASIFENLAEPQREIALAKARQSFAAMLGAEPVEKAMPAKPDASKGAKAPATGSKFTPCADCKSGPACTKMGACAAEAAIGKAEFDALAEASTAIAKAATTFAALNAAREAREEINGMIWALQDSVQSIMGDPEVADKAAMVRTSVAEFDAAIAGLSNDPEMENTPMPNTDESPVLKAAQDQIAALQSRLADIEKAAKREAAIKKAGELLPHGGPVAELADLIEKADAEDQARLTTIAKSLTAQSAHAAMFGKALGTVTPEGAAPVESAIVKAAKATAARAARAN